MKHSVSISNRSFDVINSTLLLSLMVITVYPCLYVLFASVSDGVALNAGNKFLLWPRGFQLESYKRVFLNPMLWIGYRNTLVYVGLGTALNLLLTSFAAYALSRRYLPGGKTLMKLIIFTMFFSGGMIPSYLLVMNLGMINTIFAMIIPGAISTWNLIILRSAFMGLPPSLEESAKIDGANDFLILFRIVIPLSLPAMSVIFLYYAVGHWNAFFDALIYLRKREMFPIQMVLREILILNDPSMLVGVTDTVDRMQETIPLKYATIVVSSIPILLLYPFLQKYFVKGMMIGAIKE
ncbi:carbohydrate ABC transporter permease [Paenibacillus agricola]|uniref:Carbohydrate ABC transporter permease n=1 Tax=Paenibacillus agricola TaxID=2716264 RepID=A0ABX0JFV0_9BACL|nr:carbohydrate ABC transporter permease [Paenibacillus agricola]NHN34793.1 carbohydrate ABC transporter permease [Paenibacillus agricola]